MSESTLGVVHVTAYPLIKLPGDGLWVMLETLPDTVRLETYHQANFEVMLSTQELSYEDYDKLRLENPGVEYPVLRKPGNTVGRVVGETPSTAEPASQSNPPVEAEAEEEGSFWDKAQLTLDVAGLAPSVGIIADVANTVISLGRGDFVGAGLNIISIIPGPGDAIGTAGKIARRTEKIAEAAAEKTAREAAEKVKKEAAEKRAKEQAASKNQAKDTNGENDGIQVKNNRRKEIDEKCGHLKKGANGGGAHSATKAPQNDGLDSHHMPPKSTTGLDQNDGPAIKMDPRDHHKTQSNGRNGASSIEYRNRLQELIEAGQWDEAIRLDIADVKAIAEAGGDPTKYDERIKEMLEYFECLKKHGFLTK
jgi:hypothetical protein